MTPGAPHDDLVSPWKALRPFLEPAQSEWPLPVAHPLERLIAHLQEGQSIAAYVYLREAAEGVLRVMWAVVLRDVLDFLERRPAGLAELPSGPATALTKILDHVVEGSFSMGQVTRHLAGVDAKAPSLLSQAAPVLPEGLTTHLAALLCSKPLGECLRRLSAWRNTDPGHGTIGGEARIAALLAGRQKFTPVDDLVGVLRSTGAWLARAQSELDGWPDLAQARAWQPQVNRVGIPEPVAFQGSAPLLLTEVFSAGELHIRDILGAERIKIPYDRHPQVLAERLRRTRRAAPLEPTHLELDADLDRVEAEQASRRIRTPLLDTVRQLLDSTRTWLAIQGPAGTGKSVLLRQLAEVLGRRDTPEQDADGPALVVLYHRALPGAGFDASHLAITFNEQLRRNEVRLPRQRGIETLLSPDREDARAFWQGLLSEPGNDGLVLVLIVDGLDEMQTDLRGRSLGVLPPASDRVRVIVSYRSEQELEPEVAHAMAEAPRTVLDLGAFFQEAAGHQTLRTYLEKKHRTLPLKRVLQSTKRSLAEEIIMRAGGRFLWVYHYARGLEVGFLSEEPGSQDWPTDEAYYLRYLDWLELRTGRHPGYVDTLRQVLMTLALSPVPVNDRTLLWLVGDGGDSEGEAELATYRAWVRPVLEDLDDFLLRGRVTLLQTEQASAERAAAWIVADDAQLVPADGFVRRIAHSTLQACLRGDRLGASWSLAKERAAHRLAERAREALEASEATSPNRLSARLRWAQRCALPVVAAAEGVEAAASLVPLLLATGPGIASIWSEPRLDHWVGLLRAGTESLTEVAAGEGLLRRAKLQDQLAYALMAAGLNEEAERVCRESLRALSSTAGLSPETMQEQLAALAQDRSELAGTIASCFAGLGLARGALNDHAGAAAAFHAEVTLAEALAQLLEASGDAELTARVAASPGRVQHLAIALEHLGEALTGGEDVAILQRSIRLYRALTGLSSDGDEVALRRAVAEHPDFSRDLSFGLLHLGWALLSAGRTTEAVASQREGVRLRRLIAQLPEGGDEAALALSEERNRNALRDLAMALRALGSALSEAGEASEARERLQETIRIFSALARLTESSTPEELQTAVLVRPRSVSDLSTGLGGMQDALTEFADRPALLRLLRWQAPLLRALSGFSASPGSGQPLVPTKAGAEWVHPYARCLDRLARALAQDGAAGEAIEVRRTQVMVWRALADLPEGAGAEDVSRASDKRPGLVDNLIEGLRKLAATYTSLERYAAAVGVLEEAAHLLRARVALPAGADASAIDLAVAKRAGPAERLTATLVSLSWALLASQQRERAARILEEATSLCRAVARTPPGADAAALMQSAVDRPGPLSTLAGHLFVLGSSHLQAGKLPEARDALGESVTLRGLLTFRGAPPTDAPGLKTVLAERPASALSYAWTTLQYGHLLVRSGDPAGAGPPFWAAGAIGLAMLDLPPGLDDGSGSGSTIDVRGVETVTLLALKALFTWPEASGGRSEFETSLRFALSLARRMAPRDPWAREVLEEVTTKMRAQGLQVPPEK